MATLTGEARKFTQLSTAKSVGYGLAGLYGSHLVANMIPVGPKTGWPQVLKLAGATAGIAWAGDKFLGAEAGADLFTGGAILTGLEVVGLLSGGKYGSVPADQVAATKPSKALPASGSNAQMAALPAGSVLTGVNNSTGNNLATTYAAQGY